MWPYREDTSGEGGEWWVGIKNLQMQRESTITVLLFLIMPDIFLMIIVLSVVLEALLFFVVLKGAFKNYEKKIGAPTKSGFLYILTAVYLAFCALMNYPAE